MYIHFEGMNFTIAKIKLDSVFIGLHITCCVYTCENYEVERQSHNKQINYTRDSSLFPRKEEGLSWVVFEPTTLCSLGERSAS